MIKVLIVDDDPMVAEINKRYLEKIDHFSLVGLAHSVQEAIEYIEKVHIDLILLDIYMPGKNGLELLTHIRRQEKKVDVILITAASDVDNIQTALRNGAADYLIKPFEFERFSYALTSYRKQYQFMKNQQSINQKELDKMLLSKELGPTNVKSNPLPKGLTKSTLEIVIKAIEKIGENQYFSTDNIAEKADISRVSVGKYLKYLKEIKFLEETVTYGVGRPVSLYRRTGGQVHRPD